MFDFERFCMDNGVEIASPSHKHSRPNWIQIECPFCTGNQGYHLGYNLQSGYFNCWRCGGKHINTVLYTLTGSNKAQIKDLKGTYTVSHLLLPDKINITPSALKCVLPKESAKLNKAHKKYLESRNFNPTEVERVWGLKGTSFTGSYKFRIIAPIMFQNQLCSYQGRDYTGKSKLRYKACEQKNEKIQHQKLVYGFDLVPNVDIVIVEGVTDAWRLGAGAVSTFGIDYTSSQVKLLSQFRNKYILFDDDPQAIRQAYKLANELSAFEGNVEIVTVENYQDPGSYPQSFANQIMNDLEII